MMAGECCVWRDQTARGVIWELQHLTNGAVPMIHAGPRQYSGVAGQAALSRVVLQLSASHDGIEDVFESEIGS